MLRLERLVAAGHNLLYRDERHTWTQTIRFLADECPAAVVRAWRVVAIAVLVFSLSALGGYRLLREQPEIAEQVLTGRLAPAGRHRSREVKAYVATPREEAATGP